MKTSFDIRKEVVFTPPGRLANLSGDLYLPEVSQPAPGVLLIHGGGWTTGDMRHQM